MKNAKRGGVFSFAFLILPFALAAGSAAVPDGYVVKVESATVYLDWGKTSGVQAGDRFTVFHPGEALKHPVTGEVLGHTEETLGSGVLERIDEKFSVGHLFETHGAVKPGDRTRWLEQPVAEPPPAAPATALVSTGTVTEGGVTTLPELWRSDPMKEEAAGIAFGNVLGEGRQEIVIAFRHKIQVFRWKDNHLDPAASYEDSSFRRWLAVDTGDLKGEGHDEIFATTWLEGINRPRVVVLRWDDGKLKKVADLEGFVRSFNRSDGHRHLLWQNLSRSRELSFSAPCELTWEKNAYRPGRPINLHLNDDQLFGFAWGIWDKDGNEDFAVLQRGAYLRVQFKDTRWSGNESYGGTKNDLYIDDRQAGSLLPRLASWRVQSIRRGQSDRDELLVAHNIPTLGVNLTYLKLFNKADLTGLSWNGLSMQPAWRLAIPGYLADFAIGDGLSSSSPQLWTAVVGTGDKTVLIAYQLP